MRRRFVTLDVFTNRRFTGNPLAVVLEGEGLDGKTMQAIAREFSHPETVFVLPPAEAARRARLRIFTPAAELPFAGHPTVGTAVALGLLDGGTAEREIVLEEGVGPVCCAMLALDRGHGHARFTIPRQPEELPTRADPARIAAALGPQPDELGCENYVPGNWTAGNPFTFIPVRGLHAITCSRPDPAHWSAAFGDDNPPAAYLFCRETVERGNALHARMFAPHLGVAEDPATGSAVAALAGIVTRDGGFADGTHELRIEQGYEMGRPSLIVLTVAIRGGRLIEAVIGGEAIVVTEGAIEA